MNLYFDLYGCPVEDLESARAQVELALGASLIARESDYLGEYYRADYGGGEHILLQKNYDSFEDAWFEDGYKAYPVLLYVNETTRPDEFEDRLRSSKFELLRRQQK